MNEAELISRLKQNVKYGTNSWASPSKWNPTVMKKNDEEIAKYIDEPQDEIPANAYIYKEYNMVDHPQHYNNYDVEVIDMMESIWGTEAAMKFCQMNAFKYRMRMGTKPGQPINQDLDKENWYLKKAKELKSKLKK